MEDIRKTNKDEYQIDIVHILKMLWGQIWLIIIMMIIAGAVAFCYSVFFITPKYNSSIMLYVNSSSLSVGSSALSFNSADFSNSKNLVDTYVVILKNRTTLERVAAETGVSRSAGELLGMINVSTVNNTAVFKVTVTSNDPYEATTIANGIGDILSERVSDVIDGTSARVVDSAVVNLNKISPNITKNTMVGMAAGAALCCAVLVLLDILDSVIHGKDYILETYDVPILSTIPDLFEEQMRGGRKYYNKYYSGGYYSGKYDSRDYTKGYERPEKRDPEDK